MREGMNPSCRDGCGSCDCATVVEGHEIVGWRKPMEQELDGTDLQQGFRRGRGSFVVLALGGQQVPLIARPILVQDRVQDLSQIDSARPPGIAAGISGSMSAHCWSVRSVPDAFNSSVMAWHSLARSRPNQMLTSAAN